MKMKRKRTIFFTLILALSAGGAGGLWGQSADQLYSGGRAAFTEGLWPAAASQFSRLLRRYPEDKRADSAAYMAAVAQFNAGEYKKSLAVLESFARRYPDSAWNRRTAYWEGMAHFELGSWDAASAAFLRQSRVTEEPAYRERALLYLGAGRERSARWEEAEEAYRLIVDSGRDYDTVSQALFRLAQIRLSSGRAREALDDFTRLAFDYSSSAAASDTLFWLGEARRVLGRDAEALRDYRDYLASVYRSPYRARALLEAAALAAGAGEDEEALGYLDLREEEAGGAKDAQRGTVLRIRAAAYLRTGRLEAARGAYREILKKPGSAQEEQTAAFNLAQTYIGTDAESGAVRYLVRASKGPDNRISADALYLAGTLALLDKDKRGADYLESLARRFPSDARREEALRLAVKVRREGGDRLAALRGLNILVDDFGGGEYADSYLFVRGELHLEGGDEPRALSDYGDLVKGYPRSPLASDGYSRIGFIYAGRKEYARAAKYYLQAADAVVSAKGAGGRWGAGAGGGAGGTEGAEDAGDKRRRAVYSAGAAFFNAGELYEAARLFDSLVKSGASDVWGPEAAFHLGEVYYELEDYAAARTAYAAAKRWGDAQQRFEALYGTAWSWFRESRWAQAESTFEEAALAAGSPEDAARAYYRAGLSRASAGRWEDALQSYDKALGEGRGAWREEALYQKAWALFNLGRGEEASGVSRQLAGEYPESALPADLPFRMGEKALLDGDFTGAAAWYDAVVRDFAGTEQASRAALRAAYAAAESGDAADAALRYQGWVTGHIDDEGAPAAIRSWGEALKEAGSPQAAEAALGALSDAAGERGGLTAPLVLAWVRIAGIPENAAQRLEAIAEDESLPAADRAEALLLRAHRYRMDGLGERSRRIYEVLVRDVPGSIGAEAQEGLARSYADEGRLDEAAEAYLNLAYLFPDQGELVSRARREAERLYRAAGRIEEADKLRGTGTGTE